MDGVPEAPCRPALGVRAGAIADDDLHAGMSPQPDGENLGGAIVQQVDRSVPLDSRQQIVDRHEL
jgi:hypothetical protein